LRGIRSVATRENLERGGIYTASGSWYGNDSIWRMVYDLNLVLLFGKPEGGPLSDTAQRRVVSILDAGVAGEGNGPLQALPVQVGIVAVSENPFLIDFAMARMMGFDWRKIPLLSNYKRFAWSGLSDFDPHAFPVVNDGKPCFTGIDALPVIRPFISPPGWKGHIEAEDLGVERVGSVKGETSKAIQTPRPIGD